MKDNFEVCQPWVLAHEGGYVNHPQDPGGATNQGITQRVYDAWNQKRGVPPRSVRHLTPDERDAIYLNQYWMKIAGDNLPGGIDYAMYDFAVNSGVSRSAKFAQRIVGVNADGVVGVVTLGAIDDYVAQHSKEAFVIELCNRRWAWLKTLRTYRTFGRGWTRRVMGEQTGVQDADTGVIDRAVRLARNAESIAAPPARNDGGGGKAVDRDARRGCSLLVGRLIERFVK